MGLVSKVGRRSPRARIAMTLVYLVLCLGAITTIYPFLLMLTTGLKGPTDQNDNRIVPAYLRDETELYAKYIDDKYAGNASLVAATRSGSDATPEQIETYRSFLEQLPNEFFTAGFRVAANQVTSRLMLRYQEWLRAKYGNDIDSLNKAYIEENVDFGTIQPPAEMFERKVWKPAPGRKWDEWQEFKRQLPVEFRIPLSTRRMWQEFLRSRHQNQFDAVPAAVVGQASSFEEITLPSVQQPLWQEFVAKSLPPRYKGDSVEERWEKFGSKVRTSEGPATNLDEFPDVPLTVWATEAGPMPVEADERQWVHEHAGEIRREFAVRNYNYVLGYMVLNGRALLNTAIFCLLAIATQLFVNPLAAYALSRYPIRASGKILIFLLATMAFPAEVAMIPSFLLLKGLGLLNTFAALVLPTAASGYMIFLLKGFFDSLPQELFEAGSLDGAKETTMLARIALPLSKPVLGYMALLAFMGAYGAFIYAFLIAQDQRMWTIMVFIYQLQTVAPRAVIMAALTVAALPTLLVFLLAQRVIMRGIVLPGER